MHDYDDAYYISDDVDAFAFPGITQVKRLLGMNEEKRDIYLEVKGGYILSFS